IGLAADIVAAGASCGNGPMANLLLLAVAYFIWAQIACKTAGMSLSICTFRSQIRHGAATSTELRILRPRPAAECDGGPHLQSRRVGKAKRAHQLSDGGHGASAPLVCPPYPSASPRRQDGAFDFDRLGAVTAYFEQAAALMLFRSADGAAAEEIADLHGATAGGVVYQLLD